jgi:hypothetical protein
MLRILLITAAVAVAFASSAPTISSSLEKTLRNQGKANVFIVMSDTTARVLTPMEKMSFQTRGDRLTSVANALKAHAASTQSSVLATLAKFPGLKYNSLWITNQIYISEATAQVIAAVSNLAGISEIKEEEIIPLEALGHVDSSAHVHAQGRAHPLAEAGVEKIQAHLVWDMPGGNKGEGVVVAEMSTGVRGTHEVLRHNFRGDYGWFDPEDSTLVPNDVSGIGTFSAALIAGAGGVGVAPAAKWMACRGCGEFSCNLNTLLVCGQFMACPTMADGSSPDCTKAPHVVTNNWGGGGSNWYDEVVAAWHAAGITPVFVVGLSGPSCGTAGAGDNVIAVGATHMNDTLTEGSSRGPSPLGNIKPDIVAPGVGIRSAWGNNDTAYNVISSTTPASSLLSGVIALVRSADDSATYDEIREYLFDGADTDDLTPTGANCGGISETIIPNNAYGYGRVNAYKSVTLAVQKSRSEDEMPF